MDPKRFISVFERLGSSRLQHISDGSVSRRSRDLVLPILGYLSHLFFYSLHQRLLHPGANTTDIITQYISTIKATRIIDPSGIILESVGEPIRNYLRYNHLYNRLGSGLREGPSHTARMS